MVVEVASLTSRTPASLRAFMAAQRIGVRRFPDSVEPRSAPFRQTSPVYWRFLVRRVPPEGVCAQYMSYDASGDENDSETGQGRRSVKVRVQGEEESLLATTMTDAVSESTSFDCEIRMVTADGNVQRLTQDSTNVHWQAVPRAKSTADDHLLELTQPRHPTNLRRQPRPGR